MKVERTAWAALPVVETIAVRCVVRDGNESERTARAALPVVETIAVRCVVRDGDEGVHICRRMTNKLSL